MARESAVMRCSMRRHGRSYYFSGQRCVAGCDDGALAACCRDPGRHLRSWRSPTLPGTNQTHRDAGVPRTFCLLRSKPQCLFAPRRAHRPWFARLGLHRRISHERDVSAPKKGTHRRGLARLALIVHASAATIAALRLSPLRMSLSCGVRVGQVLSGLQNRPKGLDGSFAGDHKRPAAPLRHTSTNA